jgi:hypothetical protein
MIVTEERVEVALSYLNMVPHPLALARKDVADAENRAKRSFAKAFLSADGSVDARKAHAELSSEYLQARAEEADALLELETHRARIKGAEMLLSIFQTESANTRNVERIK